MNFFQFTAKFPLKSSFDGNGIVHWKNRGTVDCGCDPVVGSPSLEVKGILNRIHRTELPSVDLPSVAPVNCAGKGKNLEQQQESSAKSKSTPGRKKGSRNKKSSVQIFKEIDKDAKESVPRKVIKL